MLTLKVLAAGALAGIAANVTGYLITGRHLARGRVLAALSICPAAIRIMACMGIALLCSAVWPSLAPGSNALLTGVGFGSILWAVTILPLVLEAALFVNWHRGFVIGLLLDWLVVCVLASVSAAVVIHAV